METGIAIIFFDADTESKLVTFDATDPCTLRLPKRNWYFYNGQIDQEKEIFEREINKVKYWATVEYIASEAV